MQLHEMYRLLEEALPSGAASSGEEGEEAEASDVEALREQVRALRSAVRQTMGALRRVLGAADDAYTLHVKLPRAQSFEELTEALDDLSFVLERPLELQFPDADVVLKSFVPGAQWLVISIGDHNALIALAKLFSVSAVYVEKKNELREREARLLRDLSEERQRQSIEMMEQSLPLVRKELAVQLEVPKEHLDEIAMALDLSAKWFERGGEFLISKEAPAEVQEAFESAAAKIRAVRSAAK